MAFNNGTLTITGSSEEIDLDGRYTRNNDSINWSRVEGTPVTLQGYGIADAALYSEVVRLSGQQTIAGVKTFSSAIYIGTASQPGHAVRKSQLDQSVAGLQAQLDSLGATISSGLTYKGEVDASTNPMYPAGAAGDVYIISKPGKIGGATNGIDVDIGNTIICKEEASSGNQGAVGEKWTILQSDLDQATEEKAGFIKVASQQVAEEGSNHTEAITAMTLHVVADKKINFFKQEIENAYVKVVPQILNDTQKASARENIAAAHVTEVVRLSGQQTIAGVKSFSEIPIIPTNATSLNHAINLGKMRTDTRKEFVRYDSAQAYSDPEQAMARGNIGAASETDIMWAAKEWQLNLI